MTKTPRTRRSHQSTALAEAERVCASRGVQFTTNRRATFDVLLQAPHALGAYDILERLQKTSGRRLAPLTVYRALEFLLEQKLVARIESKNAFVPCAHSDHAHTCVFFVCDRCKSSAEVESPHLEKIFVRDAAALGFTIRKPTIEFAGVCASCNSH